MSFTLELLGLSHRFSMKHLASVLVEKLKTMLDLKNICSILNSANLYDLKELRDACHVFMDKHTSEVLANDCFSDLTQISMIKLLQRDSFFAPEIEIFKSVAKWCKTNNDIDDLVVQCVRLSWLTVVEIVSIVWPSKLVNSENLLQAIAEIVEVKPKLSCCRAKLLTDVNVVKAEYKSQVIFGSKTTFLLTGNRNVDKYAECAIGDKNGFTIKLGFPVFLNHVNMRLWDNDGRYYSYYVEVSIDQKKWKKIVDYSQYACRSHQELYFDKQIVQYVRIVGTHNTANPAFHLIFVEAYFKSKIPRVVNGILCPTTNVATKDKKAVVVEGINPAALLDGVTTNYGNFTSHNIGSGSIVVQLGESFIFVSLKKYILSSRNIFSPALYDF
jgi:BTB/POZ domain-containing protein 9